MLRMYKEFKMDFDLIEQLSDSEISMLYNDAIQNGNDEKEYLARCQCLKPDGNEAAFGGARGGCKLLEDNGIYNEARCTRWCRDIGFQLSWFTRACFCTYSCVFGNSDGNNYGYVWNCNAQLTCPDVPDPEQEDTEENESSDGT